MVCFGEHDQVKSLDFFSSHSVFTREDFAHALNDDRNASRAVDSSLDRYLRAGRIGRVKRGVFFAAGPGEMAANSPIFDGNAQEINSLCRALAATTH